MLKYNILLINIVSLFVSILLSVIVKNQNRQSNMNNRQHTTKVNLPNLTYYVQFNLK